MSGRGRPGESAIERVMRLNPHALNADGSLKPFSMQYGEFSLAKNLGYDDGRGYTPFVLCSDSAVFGIGPLAGKPLVITNRAVRHVFSKHGADASSFDGLAREMRGHVLAFRDARSERMYFLLLDWRSTTGGQFVTCVKADVSMEAVDVNQVRSVHGKRDLDVLIAPALDAGAPFFMDRERTGAWLASQGTQMRPGMAGPSTAVLGRLLEIYHTRFPDPAERARPPVGIGVDPGAPSNDQATFGSRLGSASVGRPGSAAKHVL